MPDDELKSPLYRKTTHRCANCRCAILQVNARKKKGETGNAASRFECSNCDAKCIGVTPRVICLCGVTRDGCEPNSEAARTPAGVPFGRKAPTSPGRYWFLPANATGDDFIELRVIEHRASLYGEFVLPSGAKCRKMIDAMTGQFAGPLPLPFVPR